MGKYNKEKHKAYAERKQLGFTLFGKWNLREEVSHVE